MDNISGFGPLDPGSNPGGPVCGFGYNVLFVY